MDFNPEMILQIQDLQYISDLDLEVSKSFFI